MAEAQAQQPGTVVAAFAEHVRAFHASLPVEEQQLLEQIFSLAAKSYSGDAAEVGGYSLKSSLLGSGGINPFSFTNAWPNNLRGPSFGAGNDPLLETITFLRAGMQSGLP